MSEGSRNRSHVAPSLLLRAASVVVIAVCLAYFGIMAVVISEPAMASRTALAYAVGCGIQALCQYLAVYRRQRWAALVAALLPLMVGVASIAAGYADWINAFRFMHPVLFAVLLPQVLWLMAIVGFSVLMFRWRSRLSGTNNSQAAGSPVAHASASRVPLLDRWAVGLYLLAAGMLIASFWSTPMNSGAPAAFGSIVQPAVWFLACVGVLLGAGATVMLGKAGALGSRGALVGAIAVVVMAIVQVAFAHLGPDI